MGEIKEIASGTVGGDGSFGGIDSASLPGLNIYHASVGGVTSEACRTEVWTPYPAELQLSAVCPTPGRDSNDLGISGRMLDQDGNLFTDPVSVVFTFPSGEQQVITIEDGVFGSPLFQGAKTYIGQMIRANWEEGGRTELEITAAMFATCISPTATPRPTATPPPGFGRDPNAPPVVLARVHLTPTPWVAVATTTSVFVPNAGKLPFMTIVTFLVAGVAVWLWRKM